MKSLIINYFSILLCAQAFFACAPDVKKAPERTFRIIHNNDGSDLLGNRWFKQRPLTLADLDSCVDMVANSQVTTYMMCSGSDFFYVRSKYGHVMGDDLNGTLDCGCDTAQYNSFRKYYRNHLNLEKEGTDLVAHTLTRAKEKGMEAFITYRMNDLHFNDTTTHCPIWYTDFWIEHPEYWLNDTTQGYNSGGALDFAIKEVRDRKLAIISEQLERYDMIDGYDLDFMRFIVYFKSGTGPQNAPLMTQLVKDIRKKVDEVSAKRGKKILLSARVAPTVEQNMMKGLDVREWLRLGLLDFISTGVHWRGDPAMPVAKFREELGDDLNIPFYSSIDDGGYRPREFWSHGMHRGMCSHILSQGADGIYLFNYYFGEYYSDYDGKLHLEDGGQVCRVRIPELLQELGSLETLKGRNKVYALSDGVVQYNIKPDSPLPLKIDKGERKEANIYIGDAVEEGYPEEAILFIRTNRPATCQLTINGQAIEKEMPSYTRLYDKERGLEGAEKEYAFILPANVLKQGYNNIGFQSGDENSFTVKRVEVALKYGDVETHGYF
ncbi:hypothetical protein [uncultured Parabacteroides sp.]|uniref:hypothetical protein n=1 Tax=uncultured Parabacteroides sp. TaxID=512312 RepID=UPI0025DB0586|nr:hypothetical protein [uncultured Parabacteroides sp.]